MQHKRINEMDLFIGARLKQIRQAQKLTGTKLAAAVHINYQQLQKYEKGINRISASMLWKLSECLGVSVQDFFPDSNVLSRDFSAENRKFLLRKFQILLNDLIAQENKSNTC